MNIITSPPFSQPETRDRTPVQAGSVGNQFSRKTPGAGGAYTVDRQTMTEGNIARLSIIGSPPYAESLKPETPEQTARKQQRIATAKSVHDGRTLEKPSAGKAGLGGGYGSTPGQIGSMKGGSMTTRAIDIPTEQWYGCYDEGWGDLIVPEAYAHPAKMARGLAYKIVREGLNRNWWSKQSIIADPFGGIGTTGLVCAAHGIQAHLCELEQKFVDLARQNFELHRKQWEALGLPVPTITQGDSRRLSEVLTTAGHVVTSPPFSTPGSQPAGQLPGTPIRRKVEGMGKAVESTYGHTPGQIGAMTSPPYGATRFDGGASEVGQFGDGYRPPGNYSQDKANIGNSVMGHFTTSATSATIDGSEVTHADDMGMDSGVLRGRGEHLLESGQVNQQLRREGREGVDRAEGPTPAGGDSGVPLSGGLREPDLVSSAEHNQTGAQPYMDSLADASSGYRAIPEGDTAASDAEAGTGTASAQSPVAVPAQYTGGGCSQGHGDAEQRHDVGADSGIVQHGVEEGSLRDGGGEPASGAPQGGLGTREGTARNRVLTEGDRAHNGTRHQNAQELASQTGLDPDTYWGAVAQVYSEMYRIMSPGGHAALVLKGYVKKGKYIDLPAQTLDLLLSLGFEPVLWVDAMLVAAESQVTLDGGTIRKKRSSFFRRLYEAKHPELAIDAEIVLICRKPSAPVLPAV